MPSREVDNDPAEDCRANAKSQTANHDPANNDPANKDPANKDPDRCAATDAENSCYSVGA